MPSRFGTRGIVFVLFAGLLLTVPVSAAGIQAVFGETIPLSGYSPTSNNVYLFLTGPNLPVNGVALNDVTKRADEGGFTVVPVMGGDDSWSYQWHTSSINGHLDEGTYTVWVVNGPNDRSHLQNAEYGTISVTLGSPSISIDTPATQVLPGALVLSSAPDNASVTVNGQYRGMTPLALENLDAGTYAVALSKFGYEPYTADQKVGSGERVEIAAKLMPLRGTIFVNTSPPGANVSLDGSPVGVAPVTLENVLPGNHTIAVAKEGYVPVERQITLAAGTTVPLTIALNPASPFSALPMKAPGVTAAALIGLCGAAAALGWYRSRR